MTGDGFRSRSTNSWLLGQALRGQVRLTVADGRVAFAHNGSIRPPAALDELLTQRSQRARRGTTDSERYFLLVAQRLRDGATPAEALRTTADEIAATTPFTSLNCLLLTPDELYAFCRFDPDGDLEDKDP